MFRDEARVAIDRIEVLRRAAGHLSVPLITSALATNAIAGDLRSSRFAAVSLALLFLGHLALYASGMPHAGPKSFHAALGPNATEHAAKYPIARRIPERFGQPGPLGGLFLGVWLTLALWGISMSVRPAFGSSLREPRSVAAELLFDALAVVASLSVALAMGTLMKGREVTVGSDGIVIPGILRDRFLPYSSIEGLVEYENGGVRLHLKRSGFHVVHLPGAPGGEGLAARIRAEMAKQADAEEASAELEELDRHGRSAEAWKSDLKELARRGQGYRDHALSVERLGAVVADASISPERRVGAAVVLVAEDEDARTRIHVAADACADDDLRAALEQAAEGEIADAALERATRKLDP